MEQGSRISRTAIDGAGARSSPVSDERRSSAPCDVPGVHAIVGDALAAAGELHLPEAEVLRVEHGASGVRLLLGARDERGALRTVDAAVASHCRPYLPKGLAPGAVLDVRGRLSVDASAGLRLKIGFVARRPPRDGPIHRARRAARERLLAEGVLRAAAIEPPRALLDAARRVLLISPPGSAGRADFLGEVRPARDLEVREIAVRMNGEAAAPELARRLADPGDVDLVVLVRGGGDWRGLALFDDERLIRAIHACPVPVVLGVGHRSDDELLANRAGAGRFSTPTAVGRELRAASGRRRRQRAANASPGGPYEASRRSWAAAGRDELGRLRQELQRAQIQLERQRAQYALASGALAERVLRRVRRRARWQLVAALGGAAAAIGVLAAFAAPVWLLAGAAVVGLALGIWLGRGGARARRPLAATARQRPRTDEDWIRLATIASRPREHRRLLPPR
ncbi:exodeoxyribonuclease VII large subunit [Agromyces mediolanus]|uniref:exodeoxyribonuclease VII large subunit n=1 Tax=Agromyces mediolanus TaxID=41986 RepID=UPI001E4B5A07|nr:exodeoxyribonuclease VII large subunit [Agromyces mediolanus]MCD1569935.1 hypothetical protein [Agromyces mediolanus]